MNITITRENAICMFLLVPYDPVVAHSFLMSMEQIGRLELCYKRDKPNEPMILSKLKICSDPITYLLYQPASTLNNRPEFQSSRIRKYLM